MLDQLNPAFSLPQGTNQRIKIQRWVILGARRDWLPPRGKARIAQRGGPTGRLSPDAAPPDLKMKDANG